MGVECVTNQITIAFWLLIFSGNYLSTIYGSIIHVLLHFFSCPLSWQWLIICHSVSSRDYGLFRNHTHRGVLATSSYDKKQFWVRNKIAKKIIFRGESNWKILWLSATTLPLRKPLKRVY